MPFEVFRRHQRKLFAILAVMAMFAFGVAESLPRLLSSSYTGRDQKVVELYGSSVYQSQLIDMAKQRNRANIFVSNLGQFMPREIFGGLKQRDLIDAMILQHEADRLGIAASPEIGQAWLKQITRGSMNAEYFTLLHSRFSNEVSEGQMLSDIANQVRLLRVRGMLGLQREPIFTPYDVYRLYRDQNERIGAKLVEIPVDQFLSKVGEPSASEIEALYQKYKDALPDPARDTPGFKIPRQIQLEILSLDGTALSRGIRDKLTEAELRSYYENHKSEFEVPSELPKDLFADQPDLTPPITQPFAVVREILASNLAEEKAQAEIVDKFERIKQSEIIPFADTYSKALDEQEETKKQAGSAVRPLPDPQDLKVVADREGLQYEKTAPLSREEAQRYGQIATAEVGLTKLSGGRKFDEELFDSKTGLYEPVELCDILGTRFLVRKIKDEPAHVAPLEQVRSEVIQAWQMSQARPLAEKAATEQASRIKARGATIKDARVDSYRVITVPPITRTVASFMPTQTSEPSPAVDMPIPDVPLAGPSFRDAYFSLGTGSVEVAANQPRTIYYVMTLDRREPATFTALYAPGGEEFRYKQMAFERAIKQQDEQWMSWLRQQAGLKPDWAPPDELRKEETAKKS